MVVIRSQVTALNSLKALAEKGQQQEQVVSALLPLLPEMLRIVFSILFHEKNRLLQETGITTFKALSSLDPDAAWWVLWKAAPESFIPDVDLDKEACSNYVTISSYAEPSEMDIVPITRIVNGLMAHVAVLDIPWHQQYDHVEQRLPRA